MHSQEIHLLALDLAITSIIMNDNFILFSDFITHLKRQGFIIGVDHYMRVHAVTRNFAPDRPPEQLKSFLCPIFATNEKEQRQFSQAFDLFFSPSEDEKVHEVLEFKDKDLPGGEREEQRKRAFFISFTIGALLLVMIGLFFCITISIKMLSLKIHLNK